ncbi:hypothetical protein M9Y10_035119 [Tritrichomonas musculus]|uniref:Uncharacterized protein n=1 Tax=Tritrichomonas musculus TaxID=1915356 RepID=A0ABR2KGY5_9EUKA
MISISTHATSFNSDVSGYNEFESTNTDTEDSLISKIAKNNDSSPEDQNNQEKPKTQGPVVFIPPIVSLLGASKEVKK